MCGRFTLKARSAEVAKALGVPELLFEPRYNIAPTQEVLVVHSEGDDKVMSPMRWGLVPSWSKDGKGMINARAEGVAKKPSFRTSFRKRRCLIPADGFYEWKAVERKKQPFYFHLPDSRVFAFAGLWDPWQGQDGCAIVTAEANGVVHAVHDRMPVILDDFAAWLDPDNSEEDLLKLLRPYAGDMSVHPVSMRVNKAGEQGADLIEAVEGQSLFAHNGGQASGSGFKPQIEADWRLSR